MAEFCSPLLCQLYGEDAYNWQRRGEQNSAIEASKKDKNAIRFTGAGTARVYPKGSNVISMLSYVLGDEQWKRALNHYLKTHTYANVETNDLQQAIQDKLGIDMSWFFDQWVLRGGEPDYTVKYDPVITQEGNHLTRVDVAQTHQQDEVIGLFKMPFVVEVFYKDGTSDKTTTWIGEQFTSITIPNPSKKAIAFVLFDPNSMVMKTVQFKKGYDELVAQLQSAPHLLDRYDALIALKEIPLDKKRTVLLETLKKETFHAMKSEVINQLASDETVLDNLLEVFKLSEPQPKLAFIKAYTGNNNKAIKQLQQALQDSSYDVVGAAVEKLCKIDPSNASVYLNQVGEVYGMNNAVNIKYHELCVVNNIDANQHANVLINYAGNTWEFRTRNNAFAAIKASGVFNESLIPHLFDAMLSTNGRLAAPAADLANFLCTNTVNLTAMQGYYKQQSYSTAQKEQLKKYMPILLTN
ncbi:MAG: hypothetical protein EAY81_07645 [Bacteroidetes bacterium]|nr:MAG: hypothetical protein EAY81_07645 [Bacteroidota bacterium]